MPKVMHIGFFFDPETTGRGGVVVYQWSLMKCLTELGWDVSCLVGTRQTLSGKLQTHTRVKDGIKITELINSPLRHCDFHCDPLAHTANDEIDRITDQLLAAEQPDIVHIHDPRLHTASIVAVIKRRNIPVIKTIHNYFDLCPQGELMYQGRSVCDDYQEGKQCPACLSALGQDSIFKERMIGTFFATPLYPVLRGLWRGARCFLDSSKSASEKPEPHPLPFLPQAYVQRRKYLLDTLSNLDAVHCSSRNVGDLLCRKGVPAEKVRIIPIASGSTDSIKPGKRRSAGDPLVFCYLTGESHIKGYETLIQAFSQLDQTKARLKLYGFRDPGRLVKAYRGLSLEFHGPYASRELHTILATCDVGVVPSLWQEIFGMVGLEFLAAQMPVIASNTGGIGEWLQDGENGLMVNPGDPEDLALKMNIFIDNPALLAEMQANIKPPKSMGEHAQEIADLYHGLLGR